MSFESESSSSTSSSRPGWTYDVFLSFRGEDTRRNFTDHLYTALVQAGIFTFRDDNELPRGEEISQHLLKAIQESRISIVVFSKGYASSRWCLDELLEILECRHACKGQVVLPIFYDIDPSDVRKQRVSYVEAVDRHGELFKEEVNKVNKWREALKEAGNLSGWNVRDMVDGHESKFIQQIIEDVLNRLHCKHLNVAKHLVGIDSHVDNIISLLGIDMNDIRIVGIHGMAGIGKTTVAKVVFNRLHYDFEGSCFLLNVKEMSEQPNGQIQLQEQLLCDILKPNNWKIDNVDRGITLIKERLRHKRVLVLDDADRLEQLDALIGERNWFCPGSRIIITTRDEHLLTQIDVEMKYQAKELYPNESLQLFTWHAFRDSHPKEDYKKLSKTIVQYTGGVPLALEVLGSYLFKRSIPEWESAIKKLQNIPHQEIQRKLRISFDTLNDDKVQGIFLDIACFFVGWDKECVAEILNGRGFYSEIGIMILVDRSLVTIDFNNRLRMHNLIRDMGREIVRETSPENPGKRSRIWLAENAWDVLSKQMGTEIVEGIALDVRPSTTTPLRTAWFTKMRFLKLLQINGVNLTGSYEHLSKDLTWLCWHKCPLKTLPPNFQLDNLVVLDMQCSYVTELWKETRFLNKLKILNLSYSEYLTKTPNIQSSSVEKLMLEGCSSLVEVHQSIGHLESLVVLNLKGCCKLKNLPQSICYLKSLQTLDISMCSQLDKLPESLGDMESLTELLADGTAITHLPSSTGHLKNLRNLTLSGCNYKQNRATSSWLSQFSSWLPLRSSNSKTLLPSSFSRLSTLTALNLSYRGLSEDAISIDLGSLSSLQNLNLSGNKFFNLPSGIDRLRKLRELYVMDCTNLLSISELPLSLLSLFACNCTSLERVSIQSNKIPSLLLSSCQKLNEIQGIEGVRSSLPIVLDDWDNLANNFKEPLIQALCRGEHYDILPPTGGKRDLLKHRGEGSSISLSFRVPEVADGILEALVVWVVCAANERGFFRPFACANITNKSNSVQWFRRISLFPCEKICPNHSWVSCIPSTWFHRTLAGGEELELSLEMDERITVEKYGVNLIVNEPDDHEKWDSHEADDLEKWESQRAALMPYALVSETEQMVYCGKDMLRLFLLERNIERERKRLKKR